MISSHLVAALSTLFANLLIWLEFSIAAAVFVSYLLYLRDRFRTFAVLGQGGWRCTKPKLIIAEQFARLNHLGQVWEMQLPDVVYFSEFLLVLSFRPETEAGTGKADMIHLVLWPDSLSRSEDRRLRRYLRFDLATSLLES